MDQRGISMYLAVVLITILLVMALGTSAILTRQLKIISGIEDSVIALHAADTGIEVVLKDVIRDRSDPAALYSDTLSNGAEYQVQVYCCDAGANCVFLLPLGISCPAGLPSDSGCNAVWYCVKSKGFFGPPTNRTETQRTIHVSL